MTVQKEVTERGAWGARLCKINTYYVSYNVRTSFLHLRKFMHQIMEKPERVTFTSGHFWLDYYLL